MASAPGCRSTRFVAATNANDVVPAYLTTGRFEPRAVDAHDRQRDGRRQPEQLRAHVWLYGGELDAMRRDIAGCRYTDDDVRATIRQVYEERGYLLDPHSAIGVSRDYESGGRARRAGRPGVFLATAHPAKFAEIVEPIIGRSIERPAGACDWRWSGRMKVLRLDATLERVRGPLAPIVG